MKFSGNQGWPSVAYNIKTDEYMIVFQFRSGVTQYFNNKYIIISQRVLSSQTERAAAPSLLVKGTGKGGPKAWVDTMDPIIKYNSATGRRVCRLVLGMSAYQLHVACLIACDRAILMIIVYIFPY